MKVIVSFFWLVILINLFFPCPELELGKKSIEFSNLLMIREIFKFSSSSSSSSMKGLMETRKKFCYLNNFMAKDLILLSIFTAIVVLWKMHESKWKKEKKLLTWKFYSYYNWSMWILNRIWFLDQTFSLQIANNSLKELNLVIQYQGTCFTKLFTSIRSSQ